jgi:hypothetical protein
MPYRAPLGAYDVFVADPVDLPVRRPREAVPATLSPAGVSANGSGMSLPGATPDGGSLATEVGSATTVTVNDAATAIADTGGWVAATLPDTF